jgi:hypothetical protein
MRHYLWGLAMLSLVLIIAIGCSNVKSTDPVAPAGDNTPSAVDLSDNRAIIGSGTFEIDLENMEVRDVTDRVGAFHFNITGFIGGYFKYFITAVNPPYLTLRLEVTNPTNLQVYDVRIIYTNLYGKFVDNPDGYTDFFDPVGGPQYNPFHYFGKEYPNQAFPVGPGAKDDETLILNWPPGQPANVTYVIECCLVENAYEPIKISNVSVLGSITPEGGGGIVSCDLLDWQDDVSAVTILANDFYSSPVPMYPFRDTDTWLGTLANLNGVTPGNHVVWIKAESSNPENIDLWWPFTVNVPDVTDDAPLFDYLPYSREDTVSIGYWTYLNGSAQDPEDDQIDYLWQQLSPVSPTGQFTGTLGANVPSSKWNPPQVAQDTRYLFRVDAKERHGTKTSRALVALTNRVPLPPVITSGPQFVPNPIFEGDMGQFGANAVDPNAPGTSLPLTYAWSQLIPASPTGTWVGTSNGLGQYPSWYAPQVSADTPFQFKVTVTKGWTTPPLTTEATVDFTVKNQ